MARLNETAKAMLRDAGISQAEWARRNWMADGKWSGDICGCPDSGRCANGYHHDGPDDCGCLPTLLAQLLAGEGFFAETDLAPVKRPDGRMYRPRNVEAHAVADADEITTGVVVLGTRDVARAQKLADAYIAWQVDARQVAADPCGVWWRDSFASGHRQWVTDERHGRAGIWFREIVEKATSDA